MSYAAINKRNPKFTSFKKNIPKWKPQKINNENLEHTIPWDRVIDGDELRKRIEEVMNVAQKNLK